MITEEHSKFQDYKIAQVENFAMFMEEINERFYKQQVKNKETEQIVHVNRERQTKLSVEIKNV